MLTLREETKQLTVLPALDFALQTTITLADMASFSSLRCQPTALPWPL
jgi:hypothetical protein